MNQIILKPIGIIHSPYKEPKNIPIQGAFKPEIEAWIELYKEYEQGLRDLKEFSHAFLIYYFDKSDREDLEGTPYLEKSTHGIFAIRSPHRPNHLGLSVIKIAKIEGNKLFFTEVDMLDGTPVLDIKPYVKYFDSRSESNAGWLEKHFKDNTIPHDVILNKQRSINYGKSKKK